MGGLVKQQHTGGGHSSSETLFIGEEEQTPELSPCKWDDQAKGHLQGGAQYDNAASEEEGCDADESFMRVVRTLDSLFNEATEALSAPSAVHSPFVSKRTSSLAICEASDEEWSVQDSMLAVRNEDRQLTEQSSLWSVAPAPATGSNIMDTVKLMIELQLTFLCLCISLWWNIVILMPLRTFNTIIKRGQR